MSTDPAPQPPTAEPAASDTLLQSEPATLLEKLMAELNSGYCPNCKTRNWRDLPKGALLIECETCGQGWTLELNAAAWGPFKE